MGTLIATVQYFDEAQALRKALTNAFPALRNWFVETGEDANFDIRVAGPKDSILEADQFARGWVEGYHAAQGGL